MVKAVLVFVVAFLAQSTFAQLIGGLRGRNTWNGLGVGLNGIGCGCGGVAFTGGGLPVASASTCAPIGVSVLSELTYEGRLCAGGNLSFLGTVAIEEILPTAGGAAVSYGCGNGAVSIVSEGPIGTGILAPETFAPAADLIMNDISAIVDLGSVIDELDCSCDDAYIVL